MSYVRELKQTVANLRLMLSLALGAIIGLVAIVSYTLGAMASPWASEGFLEAPLSMSQTGYIPLVPQPVTNAFAECSTDADCEALAAHIEDYRALNPMP